jgi:hypothetical protein
VLITAIALPATQLLATVLAIGRVPGILSGIHAGSAAGLETDGEQLKANDAHAAVAVAPLRTVAGIVD